ncbi:MAG TPA: 2Fe-2S iron-sulfur cluster-binding protein [Ilumatobacter sp.]|nr:2Fe-2S iron-sulfur cluster-binding protein [Ilumatobacter sp.]
MTAATVAFTLNGAPVQVPAAGSLLDALREALAIRSAKDGCSPQGQCGCCTVWIDGQPRVACVTQVGRVAGRSVTTIEGLADAREWGQSFADHGGSQCGFCTPGIVMRAAALTEDQRRRPEAVKQAMLAHLCRCTGWQTVVESVIGVGVDANVGRRQAPVDPSASAARARIEGGAAQVVGPQIALGSGGFADDQAPPDALVALRRMDGEWVIGESLAEARALSRKVQGRRTTLPLTWPLEVPPGDWARTLRTTWVEPAYLEPDASWCAPGGEPASPLANGGAFGGKAASDVGRVARELADRHGRVVRVIATREDVVRHGAKRPPIAAGVGADGRGVIRVARTPGIAAAISGYAPSFDVEEVDVAGPPTSTALRGAGWAEAAVLLASLGGGPEWQVRSPNRSSAVAHVDGNDGSVHVRVRCGRALDPVVLLSYCIGAAHMALGWVRSEGLAIDEQGVPVDLTIRSFGILRAVDTPQIEIEIEDDDGEPVNGSDAVFAAVATAAWAATGWHETWPTNRGV